MRCKQTVRTCKRLVLDQLEPRLMLSASQASSDDALLGVLAENGDSALPYSWQQNDVTVTVYDMVGDEDVNPDNILVKFGQGDTVSSITLTGDQGMEGLGIVISGATSVGSIKDNRIEPFGMVSFIASSGSIGAISLKSGIEGYDLSEFSLEGFDGEIGGVTAIWSAGSIGSITVKGGDLIGSVIAEHGSIGDITVIGSAVFEADGDGSKTGFGEVSGGSILSPLIQASPVKGKAIGNITLTAGSLGSEPQPVDIRVVDADGNPAAGAVGNIVVKSLKYKESVQEEEVLDKWGDPKVNKYGDPIMRLVTNYAYQGGGIWTNLDTLGKLGNLITSGGDLGGEIHAAEGMGDVKVQSILMHKTGTLAGVAYTDDEANILTGNMMATLRAEPGENAVGIKSLSALGGNILGDVDVTGAIGTITTKCVGIYDEDGGYLALVGGELGSDSLHATSLGNITMAGGDLSGNVLADHSIGNVTILLGNLSGTLTATGGSVGNIAVKGAANALFAYSEAGSAGFDGEVTAGQSIGNVSVTGGNLSASLTARDSIGNITVKALTVNAWGRWVATHEEGETWWDFESGEGLVFGETLDVNIALGGTDEDINAAATLGVISGTGVEVTVNGTVPWEPANANITLKVISYVDYVEGIEAEDGGRGTIEKHVARLPFGVFDEGDGTLHPEDFIHNNLTLAE